MNIKYIFSSPSFKGSSVQTKVLSQIEFLNKAGANCKGVFFSTEVMQKTDWSKEVIFVPIKKCKWKYFRQIGQKTNLLKAISSYVKEEYKNTNYFYLRYIGGSFRLYLLSKIFGKKIISEHQSKEVEEIESFAHIHPFGFKPTKFLSWLQFYFIPLYNEKIWGNLFIRNVKSVVSVTEEISKYQKDKGAKNSIVLANGIKVEDYKLRSAPLFEFPVKLLFLKGTSTDAPWNGLNRIIESIENYENNQKIELIVCGHYIEGEIQEKNFIKHLGYLNKEKVDEIINEVHVGLSTMALYKQGLQEASSLKTREYFARGLPFIYAYTDPDLNEEAKEFSLELPNDDSLIDMEKVIEFAKKALEDKELPTKMRKYAEEHLDYEVKMKQLLENLNAL
jgi:hypothetical protein